LPVREARVWPVPPEGTLQPAPRSLAASPAGVYALDSAGRVLVYDARGECVRQWRMPDVAAGKPEGLVWLSDGHLVVCDTHYHRVVEFDERGNVARTFGREGRGPGEFIYPVAVAKDLEERLYVAEYGSNDRVQVFTRDGQFLRAFGAFGTRPGEFQRPSGLVWRDGRVYVADAFNNRIQVFTDQGAFLQVLPTPALHFPYDLKMGGDGRLYVVEYGAGRVSRLETDGRLLGRYGSSGSGRGQFATPWGLAITAGGTLLVADTGNRRIVELVLK
jgi:iron(III) transport system ATP-binding protein